MEREKEFILVPFDFTNNSENSLLHAIQLAEVADNGIFLSYSSDNMFYHNNFNGHKRQTWLYGVNQNVWDGGAIIEGNYWSSYNGTDSNGDGIGDTPYIIGSDNTDSYPLIVPWSAPPEAQPQNITLYAVAGIGIVVIVIVLVVYLLKHRREANYS